jgi:integrase
MPKKIAEKSAIEIRRLTEPGMHAVGGVAGLHLLVSSTGARSWILRAMVGSKRRDIGLGGFPDISLAKAKERATQAKDKIQNGIDPVEERKATRDALRASTAKAVTFAEAAKRCHTAHASGFRNVKHRADWISSLERYAFPVIGDIQVSTIDEAHVMQVLSPIWLTQTETATRVRQRIEAVLDWAKVSKLRSGDNPARWKGNLSVLLPAPSKVAKTSHFRALPWREVPGFMVELRRREGMAAKALEFAILTAARSGEVRLAEWSEVDLKARLWVVPASRMKAKKIHTVPLSGAAVELLKGLPRTSESKYIFSGTKGQPLSDMSISAVTKRMGADCVPHGFRSSFKDWARECTAYADEVSELALAHVNSDATRAAYARSELIDKRRLLMADWERFCSEGKAK